MDKKPQAEQPKQRTLKGTEIPLPKRSEIMDAFKKIAKAKPGKREKR